MESISSYGCYGQLLMSKIPRSRVGPPLDQFDKIFQHWQQCKRCIHLDKLHCKLYSAPLINIKTNV